MKASNRAEASKTEKGEEEVAGVAEAAAVLESPREASEA